MSTCRIVRWKAYRTEQGSVLPRLASKARNDSHQCAELAALAVVLPRALAEQFRRLNHKVEREKLVLAALPELLLQIAEFTREHGRITTGDAVRLTQGKRNTLKQHFRALVEQGHLRQHGAGRGV